MHERNKSIAELAGYGTRWNTTEEFENFLERYAELIVKDIITVVAAQALSNHSALDVFKNLNRIYQGVEE